MESVEMMASNLFEDKKRKMKTPLQLETLERVYAEEKYPSQAVRGQLSIQLGLSNRQVKMWFCHRRQKERKSKGDDEELGSSDKSLEHRKEAPVHPYQAFSLFPSLVGKSTFPVKEEDQFSGGSCNSDNDHAWKSRRRPQGFADLDRDSPKRKRSRPTISNGADSWRVAELQAIASVEAQLGEPLRWDSPCLGIEFDPLPPGAFGSPAVPSQCWKPSPTQDVRNHLDSKNESKIDLGLHRDGFLVEKSRSWKVAGTDNGPSSNGWSSSRLLQEYQFIPERPTGREEMVSSYEISGQVKTFPQINRQELVLQDPFLPESESLKSASRFEGKPFSAGGGLFIQRDIYHTNVFPQSQLTHQDLLPNLGFDGHPGGVKNLHHALPASCVFPDLEKMPLYNEHEVMLESKKRKIEEIKIAKEVEAYRKRIQREAEREELARRKRIEQLQREQEKEAEKLVREKQREDERLMRDKQREDERLQRDRQREEERLQREARRESERLERLAQKEAQRLEREREKEEARRQKEATRLKAAIERATARRLARECVELIDDERLELLEVAATSQGLPSIYLLDGETLQGLDRFKDCLKKFPPPTVKMKIPLRFSPWADSHQNVGNLFMVWRFLIAFTDVLGLWPFTLDELVQAFHDYDSRLLAEIHMALFRTIVKDVEDVAKAAASSGAVNQYTAPSTIGGGHTQLVEAAFARGFDYRDWSRLLSPSTWPDILRQFGIAAGFGSPLWKHPTVEGREVVCKGNVTAQTGNVLRSGGAGSNSSVFLKSKMCFTRKVGHRLTPGTVKFSAFHVLSVAGARGLSIAEVASRIEKYGLRNLTASKTPESTIAAALSRDMVFFERVAPSTYCVKAAYRKNPEDAERLIQEALEKTRLFHSGVLDAYDLEKGVEGSDEVERELNSGDELEDMEADVHQKGSSVAKHRDFDTYDKNVRSTDGTGKHQSVGHVNGWTQSAREGEAHIGRGVASLPDNKADETDGAEPWVKGLIKGEYTGLSVDERLDALVALVEAVNEGNTIRVALEERLEAATALKRQMWAEAQLDKRRTKEEQLLKAQSQGDGGGGSEGMKGEGGAAPLMDDAQTAGNVSPAMDKDGGPPTAGISSSEKSRAQLKAEIDFRADELYVFRSTALGLDRRRNRYWQFVTSYTAEDPGCGRVFFESSEDGHWEVIDNEEAFNALMASLDTRGTREAQLLGVLQKLEGLIRQGMRRLASFKKPEQNLLIPQSEGNSGDFPKSRSPSQDVVPLEGMSSGEGSAVQVKEVRMRKGAIQVELGITQSGKERVLRQYRDFDRWLWSREAPGSTVLSARRPNKKRGPELLAKCETCHSLFWDEEKQCSCCCRTSAESDAKYSRHLREGETKTSGKNAIKKLRYPMSTLPSRVQLLKAQMLSVEAAVPAEALKTGWTEKARKTWASSIKHASSASELLQLLSELESAVSRDWLPRSFECSKDVLESGRAKATGHSTALLWIPRTTAAVAMRLAEFDAAVLYGSEQKLQSSHSRRKAYGASKKSQSTDTVAPSSFAEEGDHLLKDSGKQCSPNERKHAKRKVVMKGVLNVSKDLRGCDGGANASIMEKAVIKDRRGGKGKQFLPLDDEPDEHAQVSKIQRVDDQHELRISGKRGFQDLDHQSSPKFHYQEEDAFSVEVEEVEEEVIIDEDEEDEEEGGECAMQDRRWANANEKCEADLTAEEAENGEDEGVDEGCETYSTEEEGHSGEDDGCGDDEVEQDQYDQRKSEQECHVVGSSGEEDSEDDESSDGSTDSESSDESD